MLEGKFDFNHDKHSHNTNNNRNENELGWKLFVLKLSDIIATATVKLAWITALIWAFGTMLNHR